MPGNLHHLRDRTDLDHQLIEVIGTNHREMLDTGFLIIPLDVVQKWRLLLAPADVFWMLTLPGVMRFTVWLIGWVNVVAVAGGGRV